MDTKVLQLFHIFAVSSLFLYVGTKQNGVPSVIFPMFMFLAVVIFAYHMYRFVTNPSGAWINIFHILIVAPLLLYIGFNGTKTERKYYEYLLLLGFAAFGYHLFYLFGFGKQ